MTKKITVSEKQNNNVPETISEYLKRIGIPLANAVCGGKETCGKCLIHVEKPYKKNVLACKTAICEGMEIWIEETENMQILKPSNKYSFKPAPDGRNTGIAAACDIGTTTIVCSLIDTATGQILATRSGVNRQRCYGADVISRIEAASPQNLARMKSMITGQINKYIEEMLTECGRDEVGLLAVAGNTVMCYLLMGISPKKLGHAPYIPDELFGKEYNALENGIKKCQNMIIFPAVAGFVGGDVVSGLVDVVGEGTVSGQTDAAGKDAEWDDAESGQAEVDRDCLMLFLDIGTNGEIVLGRGDKYICCATAAGPAFEGAGIELGMAAVDGAIDKVWLEDEKIHFSVIGGGNPAGFCGSGLIDALFVMRKAQIIDSNGTIRCDTEQKAEYRDVIAMVEDITSDKPNAMQPAVYISSEVYVTQEDIRRLQLAKSAIAAGIEILFSEYNCKAEDIDRFVLAGGFGNYIDISSAAGIGLFPGELKNRAVHAGNTAGNGAAAVALSPKAWEKALWVSDRIKYIELASHPAFEEKYIELLSIP